LSLSFASINALRMEDFRGGLAAWESRRNNDDAVWLIFDSWRMRVRRKPLM